jgi:hypothetical protein
MPALLEKRRGERAQKLFTVDAVVFPQELKRSRAPRTQFLDVLSDQFLNEYHKKKKK